jgi:4-hydroxybenzoate polyprenyltransferase
MPALRKRIPYFLQLIRFEKPIGSFLLLWPTWWALWIAAEGTPDFSLLLIFTMGVFLTRSAGCIINDYADREFDRSVLRTRDRPLTSGRIKTKEAIALCAVLLLIAFGLVLLTNPLTIMLSFVGVLLAACYPFLKRHTHLPQFVLGMAFSWGIPMAFAATTNSLPPQLWLIYTAAILWTVIYDTCYAMVDRNDDIKLGLKSTAILFGEADRAIIAVLQGLVLLLLVLVGLRFELGYWHYAGIGTGAVLFLYQQALIRERQRDGCFRAFLNNNLFGLAIFTGIALHYFYKV